MDDAYGSVAYIPNANRFVPHWGNAAQIFYEQLKKEGRIVCDIPYGLTERQKFEFFLKVSRSENVLIFIKGGYRSRFDKSYWSHLATGALQQKWHVAMPSFSLCPDVSISDISKQIAKAVAEIQNLLQERLLWLAILLAATL